MLVIFIYYFHRYTKGTQSPSNNPAPVSSVIKPPTIPNQTTKGNSVLDLAKSIALPASPGNNIVSPSNNIIEQMYDNNLILPKQTNNIGNTKYGEDSPAIGTPSRRIKTTRIIPMINNFPVNNNNINDNNILLEYNENDDDIDIITTDDINTVNPHITSGN